MVRARGSRPPRGRDLSQFSRPPPEASGELNAGLTERFGRGPAFKPRDQSSQPRQPPVKMNAEVQRYFSRRRIGAGAPRWTCRPEVPTPEELLPYPELPTQTFVPNTRDSHDFFSQPTSGWGVQATGQASGWGDQPAGNGTWQSAIGNDDAWATESKATEAWSTQPASGDNWQQSANDDAWATESKATKTWSTQPASGDNWQQEASDDAWATQQTGTSWENDAWAERKGDSKVDPWQANADSKALEHPVSTEQVEESNGSAEKAYLKLNGQPEQTDKNEDASTVPNDEPAQKDLEEPEVVHTISVLDEPDPLGTATRERSSVKDEAEVPKEDSRTAPVDNISRWNEGDTRGQDRDADLPSDTGWGTQTSPNQGWEEQTTKDQSWDTQAAHDQNSASQPAQNEDWQTQETQDHGWGGGTASQEHTWNSSPNNNRARQSAVCIQTSQEEDDTFESFDNVSNIIDAPWPSKMDYLRSHYLLLREDALRPLREAVNYVRSVPDLNEDPSRSTIGIYDQVQVCGITFARRGLGIRVKFSLGRVGKNIHWAQSKRLITGTLVILMSPDKSICKVATVAARPLELLNRNPPEVDLFFGRAEDLDVDCSQDWIMIEERGSFFEAQRHTLVALQRMVDEKFPLQEHLINLETSIPPPAYVEKHPIRDLRPISSDEQNQQALRNVDILQEWPSDVHPQLDDSQMNALNTILTKRLSVVQGPPGTGKTYVSVEALKVMLRNLAPDDPPIIITCQTNHALDQLLSHVARFEEKYVRIGARSSNEEIKKRTLYELKADRKPPPFKGMLTWRKLESEIAKLIAPLIKATAGLESRDTFDLELLRDLGVLSHQQCDSVIEGAKNWISHEEDADDRPLLKWIGKQLEPVKQRQQAMLVGYEEIDEGNIGFEEVMEQEAEQVVREEDDEYEGLGGTFWPIGDTWTGRTLDNKQARNQATDFLKTYSDLWKIRTPDRGNVYRHIQREAKIKITARLRQLFPQYEKACGDRKIHRFEHEESILREMKVVGLTTTGVSKYRGLIASLQPKIVLIEEAAETLEGPVIAACMESIEHLILVGDHKQLRPNTHVMELQKPPYNLNISLFERLVNNDVTYSILARQRRMKPEIRRLLKPIYGTSVRDHESVQKLANRRPIPGMGGLTTWFFTHEYPDDRDQEFSCFNTLEAEMILGLVQYLHYNGVAARDITILTFYNGQRRLIRRLFAEDEKARGNADLRNVQLVTVDSYQGEENAIVILSLVRSNMDGKIGFIGVDNRVCVALSRAQRGFYILGNAQLLCNESWLWSEMISLMWNGFAATPTKKEEQLKGPELNTGLPDRRRIGFTLPLWCKKHQRQFWIRTPDDWRLNVGGCNRPCRGRLPCGHQCPERCHPWAHELYDCMARCERTLECGHGCKRACYQTPCECARGCNGGEPASASVQNNPMVANTETPRALPQSPQSFGEATRRYQQFAHDGAVNEDWSMDVYLSSSKYHQEQMQRRKAEQQKQLDEENTRLLFMDDASQGDAKHKLVGVEKGDDGSITRVWQVSHQSKPQRKATVAAEQQFLSLMDQDQNE